MNTGREIRRIHDAKWYLREMREEPEVDLVKRTAEGHLAYGRAAYASCRNIWTELAGCNLRSGESTGD